MIYLSILCFLIVGTVPILFAAVQPWVWSFYTTSIITVYILYIWLKQSDATKSHDIFLRGTLAIFFIWTLILNLKLPLAIISILSPKRAHVLSQASELTLTPPEWATLSYSSNTGLAWWVFLLSLVLLYIVIKKLCTDRKSLKRFAFVIIVIGILESIYGLLQALIPSMGVLWVDYVHDYLGTARGTFINRNNFAAFVEMVAPIALGVTLSMTSRAHSLKEMLSSEKLNRQALMALGLIVLFLALVLTRSRAGIFSGFIGLLIFSIMVREEFDKVRKHSRMLLASILTVFCVYTMAIGVGTIADRFLAIGDDGNLRLLIWRDSLNIVREHPLGIGLNNYENVFNVYNKSFTSDKSIIHAHNDYLQILIESGWIGFISIVSWLLLFLKKSAIKIKKMNAQRDPLRFYLAVGAFSGLISVAIHCLFDFNLQIPANCVYFVTLAAILTACTQHKRKRKSLIPQNVVLVGRMADH